MGSNSGFLFTGLSGNALEGPGLTSIKCLLQHCLVISCHCTPRRGGFCVENVVVAMPKRSLYKRKAPAAQKKKQPVFNLKHDEDIDSGDDESITDISSVEDANEEEELTVEQLRKKFVFIAGFVLLLWC